MPKHLDRPLKWTATVEQAVMLAFAGRYSHKEIADKCGVATRTYEYWLAHPDFHRRLEELRSDFATSVRDVTFADKARRIIALDDAAKIALRELEERPLLKEVRPTREGEITNEAFNNTAMSEFRGALDDIAKELGQRKNVTEVTGKDGGPIELSAVKQQLAAQLADRARRQRALPAPGEPE